MPVITQLTVSKSGKAITIHFDKEDKLTLSPDEVYAHRLKLGQEITNKEFQQLKQKGNFEKHYLKSLKRLSYRPRSTQEITAYLTRNNVDNKTSEKILQKLQHQNYLNDLDFAFQFTQSKANQFKGPILINARLISKGIDPQVIDQALKKIFPDDSVIKDLAQKSLNKKLPILQKLTPIQFRIKASQHLYRQGFPIHIINAIFTNLID